MNRSEIIDLADSLTERKATKVLNLRLIYQQALQKFCMENRFWWRKKTITFSTVANTATYDLTTDGTILPADAGLDVEEIVSLYYLESSTEVLPLDPVFDPDAIAGMMANTVPDAPSIYTVDLGTSQTLRINLPADAYSMRMVFWAMPNPPTDDTSDAVPLIPRWLHMGIVHAMCSEIFAFLYGDSSPKFLRSEAEYKRIVNYAQTRGQFTSNYTQQFVSEEDAIRST